MQVGRVLISRPLRRSTRRIRIEGFQFSDGPVSFSRVLFFKPVNLLMNERRQKGVVVSRGDECGALERDGCVESRPDR
jgi:hypothetical protein